MLRSATLLSRLKDEVKELIPECAIHVDSIYAGIHVGHGIARME